MAKKRRGARKKRLGASGRKKHPGASPGTLVHIGDRKADQIQVKMFVYDEQRLEERNVTNVADLAARSPGPAVTWVNVDGLHEVAVVEQLGNMFSLHPLVLEDILNTEHHPKMEDYENYLFVVLRLLSLVGDERQVCSEQVSLVLGRGFVLTFQETVGDVFEPIRQRVRAQTGRIRKMGSDYLFYALIDAVVDHYFVVLDKIGERLEVLETSVFENPNAETLAEIQQLRLELLGFRKAIWPLREAINGLLREESELISEKTEIFLRDVYDHTIQVLDTVEGFRDTVSGLMDVYLSNVSNRMNEVMKVLTIIATIFIPLTFIAGIYGMNFEYMPELQIPWAYPLVWLAMVAVALIMIVYFRRKGWF